MDKRALLALLNKLDLPDGEYVLTGGACLTIRGLRSCDDLDIFVTQKLFDELSGRGWQQKAEGTRTPYLDYEIDSIPIQAFTMWDGPGWRPKVADYLKNPEFCDGLPMMPLKDLYEWKRHAKRPKDLKDLMLISRYWKNEA